MIRQRCAIYTRKSTEEGLDQSFNSLDAQREACAAYILSQRHEGWTGLAQRYDDGGYSGGSMERPGLQRLIADVEARRIDVIVVYKVDRLTRSLADFAKMVEVFDGARVSFVSVTQAFNTTSSMGRLTLNVLLSFAQFEREVTAERIRDKVAASKRKGMWMGGSVPVGYEARDRSLVVNPVEAEAVRTIFEAYLTLGSVPLLRAELDRRGIVSKRRTGPGGLVSGGQRFSRGALYHLLRNPIYRGKVRHRGNLHDGQHEAIVEEDLWRDVQALLDGNGGHPMEGHRRPAHRWLDGRLLDREGRPMKATYAQKAIPGATRSAKTRYWYYATKRADGGVGSEVARLPADPTEEAIRGALADYLQDRDRIAAVLADHQLTTDTIASLLVEAKNLSARMRTPSPKHEAEPAPVLTGVRLGDSLLRIELDLARLDPEPDRLPPLPASFEVTFALHQNGRARPIVVRTSDEPRRDPDLIALLADAKRWRDELLKGRSSSIESITARERLPKGAVSRILPLAWIAPDIAAAIVDGTQPATLTAKHLRDLPDLPLAWPDQRTLLGFPAR